MRRALMCWVELHMDLKHIFLVPQVLQNNYGRVNKHVNLLVQPPLPPICGPQPRAIPFLISHLPRFRRQIDAKVA
jgi:hypothetical protein